jgi:proline iminopeptidase
MLDVGDGNLVYWEACGNPDGKPAVVLHGGPGSGCTPLQRRLFDPAAYRIVLFDQRGCGRSTPHASPLDTDLASNTTWHLLADIERLRVHLKIDTWLVFGGSWGATLAILYAETHAERVTEMILSGVTTTRREELDWLYRGGLAPLLPEQWARFLAGLPIAERDGDPIEAYRRLLHDPDPSVRERAAESWCRWETATVSRGPGPELAGRFADPAYAMAFARIVTHYFGNAAWLEEGRLLQDASALARVPGIMVHGRLDLQAPLATAWELKQVWPRAELVIVDDAGHALGDPGMVEQIIRATDRFTPR